MRETLLGALLSFILACADVSSEQRGVSAPAGDTTALVVVSRSTAIGYFPPAWDSAQAEESGYAEGIAHVGFALADAEGCLGRDNLQTVMVVDTAVRIRNRERLDTLRFSRVDSLSYGVILVAPGNAPRVINAIGPSALAPVVAEAIVAYFRHSPCRADVRP